MVNIKEQLYTNKVFDLYHSLWSIKTEYNMSSLNRLLQNGYTILVIEKGLIDYAKV